jgi:hypothetical protein
MKFRHEKHGAQVDALAALARVDERAASSEVRVLVAPVKGNVQINEPLVD